MKLTKIILTTLFFSFSVYAQSVDVHVNDITPNADKETMGKESDGAIIIKKGSADIPIPKYEVTQGEEEITGDAAPLLNQARSNWKKACAEWKKELKENNKDNQIITSNCGSMNCSTGTAENICKSKANYKIKVKTGQ